MKCAFILFIFIPCSAWSQIINTIAGNGLAGFSGDGGMANIAQLNYPPGVAVDSKGNIYIADCDNHRIRKVNSEGRIMTLAGIGFAGFSGDGGPASAARINRPVAIAIDKHSNIYFAEHGDHRVRKIDVRGIISTVAGNGRPGFSGDGGPATNASLYDVWGVAVDKDGNVFIADNGNCRLRKVDNGMIYTIAGTGQRGFAGDGSPAVLAVFNTPNTLSFDRHGNLYVTDYINSCVRKIDRSGIITTVAGSKVQGYCGDGGPATSACLNRPNGVAFDNAGNMFISDQFNNRIRKVDGNGIISTYVGIGDVGLGNGGYSGDGGPATAAMIKNPINIATNDNGDLYIADQANQLIRKVSSLPTKQHTGKKKRKRHFKAKVNISASVEWGSE